MLCVIARQVVLGNTQIYCHNQICVKFEHSEAVGTLKYCFHARMSHLVKLPLPNISSICPASSSGITTFAVEMFCLSRYGQSEYSVFSVIPIFFIPPPPPHGRPSSLPSSCPISSTASLCRLRLGVRLLGCLSVGRWVSQSVM